jgi:D-ribose pyranase
MLKQGILNPAINSLLSRVRHTNTVVIADRGFPFWANIEIIDISLVDDIPTVLDVLQELRKICTFGAAYMASEFRTENSPEKVAEFARTLEGISLNFETHQLFKTRVPFALGLIRTGDTTQFANVILESA